MSIDKIGLLMLRCNCQGFFRFVISKCTLGENQYEPWFFKWQLWSAQFLHQPPVLQVAFLFMFFCYKCFVMTLYILLSLFILYICHHRYHKVYQLTIILSDDIYIFFSAWIWRCRYATSIALEGSYTCTFPLFLHSPNCFVLM